MYGRSNLKPEIRWTNGKVECPVIGCDVLVPRQRERFRCDPRFLCQVHHIYISPTTFAYESEEDNLLWADDDDLELLRNLKDVKRESRMHHNNSEDAVSWNCFRHFEREGLLGDIMKHLGLRPDGQEELIYWPYSPKELAACQWLVQARNEFGEEQQKSSEPDLILRNTTSLVFLEAKLLAPNNSGPSNPSATKDYLVGGEGWYGKVFRSSYEDVALRAKLYELLRFWLLGTWIAHRQGLDFRLANLVREGQETDIADRFGQHIISSVSHRFVRTTWQNIFRLADSVSKSSATKRLIEYAREKTLGYDQTTHQLIPAFNM